ncbi:YncE family protein [Actinomadura sp. KC06]|uniref:YncE family protein n=1 Tax=Actinomadura sp. KC06 TaxID=2530369 RepID=UPI001404879D|nr:YncE family protein [Actinomadura sp. KC06]
MFSVRHVIGATTVLAAACASAFGVAAAADGPSAFPAQGGRLVAAVKAQKPTPISDRDRVYTADQSSNTVTVIDPASGKTLGSIRLGDQRLGLTLNPQYLDNAGVHGLGYHAGRQRLGVVSVASNTVDIIDTRTNKVLSHTDAGRAAHEGNFTADGGEFWVADRGRDTVTIVDADRGGVDGRVKVGDGPSKVLMSPDGRFAYVNHISAPEITVVDVKSRRVTGRITGLADPFSSDAAISPDGKEIWAAHKRVGKVSVVDLATKKVKAVLNTGPDTNHPNFADNSLGSFVYLTVGGLDQTLVYERTESGTPRLVTRVRNHGRAPHGSWPNGDGTRMYVGLEKSDAVDVIDTKTNRVIDTIKTGQEPQAIVYAPGAVSSPGSAPGLGRQGLGQGARSVATVLPDGSDGDAMRPGGKGRILEATVRPVGGLDMVQLQARDLRPATTYQAYAVEASGRSTPLVSFTTDEGGKAPQVLSFSQFTGKKIVLKSKGRASAQTLASLKKASDHSHEPPAGREVDSASLLFCCC